MHQTTLLKTADVQRNWHQVSAKGVILGKLAVRIANVLSGRAKVSWTPHTDNGDFVVVTDAEQIVVTGPKATRKTYKFHTGYIGGLNEYSFETLQKNHPERIIELAVRRMLPKNQQAKAMIRRLKVYAGSAHPHTAQSAKPLP